MVSIIISGACGRVGRNIALQALARKELRIVGALETSTHPECNKDLGAVLGTGTHICPITADGANTEKLFSTADCVIEFTNAATTRAHLAGALKAGKAMVIGTTALEKQDIAAIREAARKIPIVWSSNMSRGVGLLLKLAAYAAKVLGDDFDVEISETHHNKKKDAPSGTAISIAQTVAEARGVDYETHVVCARHGATAARKKGEIGISSIRAGDVVGDHTVVFAGDFERIELTHRAHSREVFARGALDAALFVAKKTPGLYTMRDVLGIQ